MIIRLWIYFFKNAFINILNNRLVHLISIGTITISMLIFGSFLLLSVNINNWVKEWGQSLSMSVYLDDGISDKNKKEIESKILALQGASIKGLYIKRPGNGPIKRQPWFPGRFVERP